MAKDDETFDPTEVEETTEGMRSLRQAYDRRDKQAREAASKAEALERENAALRAGVAADTPLGKGFMATFDGDWNDTEAVLAAARAFHPDVIKGTVAPATPAEGIPSGETAAPTGAAVTPEPTGTDQRTALADGAEPAAAAMGDPRSEAFQIAQEGLAKGARWQDATGGAIAHLARAAAEGRIEVTDSNGRPMRLPG